MVVSEVYKEARMSTQRSRASSAASIQAKLARMSGGQPGSKQPGSKQPSGGTMQNEQGPISPQGPTSGSAKPGDRVEDLRESSSESGQ